MDGDWREYRAQCIHKARNIEMLEDLIEDAQHRLERFEFRDVSAKLVEFQAQLSHVRDAIGDRDTDEFRRDADRANELTKKYASSGPILDDAKPLKDAVRDIRGGLDNVRISVIFECVMNKGG